MRAAAQRRGRLRVAQPIEQGVEAGDTIGKAGDEARSRLAHLVVGIIRPGRR